MAALKVIRKALIVLLLLQSTAFAQQGNGMSPGLRKQLDVFFSNFSEVNLQGFKKGQLSDKMLVDFALWHCTFNLLNTLKKSKDGGHALADAALVDTICMKYFGVKPREHKSHTYNVDLASGEVYIFSQVDRLTKTGDDTYTAQGTIYYTGSGGTPDPHGPPPPLSGKNKARTCRHTAPSPGRSGKSVLPNSTTCSKNTPSNCNEFAGAHVHRTQAPPTNAKELRPATRGSARRAENMPARLPGRDNATFQQGKLS